VSVISAAELAEMRAIADDFFPDTCSIGTVTQGVDATGSPTETFTNTYTGVACRVDPADGDEEIRNMALEGESSWWLNIPYDQPIDETYQVIHDGRTYQIKSVWDTQSYRTIRRALMIRIG
jgi:SPP1 family predicted phage head-tail adaptor